MVLLERVSVAENLAPQQATQPQIIPTAAGTAISKSSSHKNSLSSSTFHVSVNISASHKCKWRTHALVSMCSRAAIRSTNQWTMNKSKAWTPLANICNSNSKSFQRSMALVACFRSSSKYSMAKTGPTSIRAAQTSISAPSVRVGCSVSQSSKYKLRHTRTLAVNLEELTDVPDEVFQLAQAEGVHVVDFARNNLRTLPKGLQHMQQLVTELVLAHNLIAQVPQFISQFTRISLLNLSNNLLTDLPKEFGVLNTLRELNIANNRFAFIPNGLYDLQGLEILIASDNHIKELNVSGLKCMPRLSTLDLRNNDIDFIPPILGTLTNITHLELVGNPFRQPRHQILMKGTESIMSYLRDRVPR
ncbi:leucine-rich repeat-containing protein 40 isoform X4 [Drosophila guanche]|uniref:leucine-rich repeat-containing protein 40 isoform X4 n=1 Tax=Drosophila guanche TaxID=7266 RepID=UPI00147233AB|nr:leucine-rich repeat-containing protein 40 isoform X4 [Drosophila guanche]